MRIAEYFNSIQGEGIYAGEPMSFIRLAGCNLACEWCDTKYARRIGDGQEVSVAEINPSLRWVCITGGEPLLQQDELASLILKLKHMNKWIEIETNGSIPPPVWAWASVSLDGNLLKMVDSWVIDVKLSSSGNPSSYEAIAKWASFIGKHDQIKFVVADHIDLNEAEIWLEGLPRSARTIISPAMPCGLSWARVTEFCIEHNTRLSLQLHKIIWGDKRGV